MCGSRGAAPNGACPNIADAVAINMPHLRRCGSKKITAFRINLDVGAWSFLGVWGLDFGASERLCRSVRLFQQPVARAIELPAFARRQTADAGL